MLQSELLNIFVQREENPNEGLSIYPDGYGESLKEHRKLQILGEEPINVQEKVTELEEKYPKPFELLRACGVYPGKLSEAIDPYTDKKNEEYFGNVGQHCVAVALMAEAIAKSIYEGDKVKIDRAVEQALIHDAMKMIEVKRRNYVKAQSPSDASAGAYTLQAYEAANDLLVQQGVIEKGSEILEYLKEAGRETGHNSLASFVVLDDRGNPTLNTETNSVDMIVHLADDMSHTPVVQAGQPAPTWYLTAQDRMVASDFPERYKWMYKEGFGFDSSGASQTAPSSEEANEKELTNFKTYAEWQVWVAEEIAKHLMKTIDPNSQEDAQEFILNLVRGQK